MTRPTRAKRTGADDEIDFRVWLRAYRGNRSLRVAARESGVTASTIHRVERGLMPDVQTFAKLCAWMEVVPVHILAMLRSLASAPPRTSRKGKR